MVTESRSDEYLLGVGKRLQRTRKALKLKQGDLAEQMGVTRGALANWERGYRLADISAMVKLKRLYGVTFDWIYDDDPSGLPHHLAQTLIGQTLSPLDTPGSGDEKISRRKKG